MNVGELKRLLELMNVPDDFAVVVAITNPGMIGPTPSVCIDKAGRGFDWNNGKLLLYPKESLVKEEKRKKE